MAEKQQQKPRGPQPPRKSPPLRKGIPPRRGAPPRPTLVMPPRRNKNLMMVLLLMMVGLFMMRFYASNQASEQVERTTFLGWMSDTTVLIYEMKVQRIDDAILVTGRRSLLSGEQPAPVPRAPLFNTRALAPVEGLPFTTYLLQADHDLLVEWEAAKAPLKIDVVHEGTSWLEHLFAFLPILLLIGFFWFMMARQNNASGGKSPFSFGKSRAKLIDPSSTKTTFKDVAGCDEAKEDLREIVEFLKSPQKFTELGGRIPKGVLLLGPPGTGKTLLARAVAGEAKRPFFSMSGSDFVEMFVGVGASRVRDLFEQGRKNAPCIIFIDEIDAVGRQRGAGLGGGHDEREQTLNQLLVEMDGFEGGEGVILLAATNRPDVLDRALLRPGRLDRRVVVDSPDARGREEILEIHVKKRKVPLGKDVDLKTVAKGTPGMSGADLENLVNEAALLAARYDAKKVSMIDFEEAKDKLMMGTERRSRVLSVEDRRTTAYHEAGHALVTHLVEHSDPLHKLTIIPRGAALGITFSLPEKDRYTMDRAYLEDMIAVLLAGRAAEWLIFKQRTTGASNDLERVTEIARRMATEWGMTDELGPVVYRKKKEDVFLGRDLSERPDHSETTAQRIDEVVRDLVVQQNERVEKILSDNKAMLISLAEALLEHEVLDREEILRVFEGESLEFSKKSRQYSKLQKAEERRKKLEKEEEESLKRAVEELTQDRTKELTEQSKPESEELTPTPKENPDAESGTPPPPPSSSKPENEKE